MVSFYMPPAASKKIPCVLLLDLFQRLLGGDISQLPQLLLSVCETVKDEALALIDNTRHMNQAGETQVEDEDSMETDSPRGQQKDQRDGVRRGQNTSHKDTVLIFSLFWYQMFFSHLKLFFILTFVPFLFLFFRCVCSLCT